MENRTLFINGKEVGFADERNLLEVIRKAGINLPTFCYHSELSVYGACRLCIVDIAGRGIMSSCSIKPEAGMKVKTHTTELRDVRKMTMELLLANHAKDCTSCSKSLNCKLQELSAELGVGEVRLKKTDKIIPLDLSSDALTRDPNKCILCGDCVRACDEIQGIGAIDFSNRGSEVMVVPAFNKNLADVECVDCGQCARVCPTGAIVPKSNTEQVWKEIENDEKIVVAQIAPAVRVAIGELFGLEPGQTMTGQIVSALKLLGFDKVYDTSFAADLTVLEEANEFLHRKESNSNLPLFTSCCPGWVKYAEQYYPELLGNLSSCKSPQQMFGSLAKEILPGQLKAKAKDITIVSIMPCTAKKVEANRPEFTHGNIKDVDYVLTTTELAKMIKEAGLSLPNLAPESLDLPLGFKTGAGVIFGSTGGVSEAVLRYVYEKVTDKKLDNPDFVDIRGNEGIKEYAVELNGETVKIAIVHGLKNAKTVAEKVKAGKSDYALIEVMACPGGCVGGAGQPVQYDEKTRGKRAKGLYDCDKMLQLHKSQENPYIKEVYDNHLKEPGSDVAHKLLHTSYSNRKRIFESGFDVINGSNSQKLEISVCVGTGCYVKGSQNLLHRLIRFIDEKDFKDAVNVKATFCMESCDRGPSVTIGDELIHKCTFELATEKILKDVAKLTGGVQA